jgi:hypothetical protein
MLVGIAAPAFIAITANLPWMSLASLFAAILVFGISFPQSYETRPDALIIRSGFTTRLITYDRLKGIKPFTDGRVVLNYGIGTVFVAPVDRQAFIDDVASRAPQLCKQGEDFVTATN